MEPGEHRGDAPHGEPSVAAGGGAFAEDVTNQPAHDQQDHHQQDHHQQDHHHQDHHQQDHGADPNVWSRYAHDAEVSTPDGSELSGQELDAVIAAIMSQPGTSAGPTSGPMRVIQPAPPGIADPPLATTEPIPHTAGSPESTSNDEPPQRAGVQMIAGVALLVLTVTIAFGWWLYASTRTPSPDSATVSAGTRTRAADTIGLDPTVPGDQTTNTPSTVVPNTTVRPTDTTAVIGSTTAATTSPPTVTTTPTPTTATTTAPSDGERDAINQLEAWRADGRAQISLGAGGSYVQLSAKQIGLFDEEQNRRYDTWQSILDDHRRFREQYGAILLFSDDVNKNPAGYYLTWYPTRFPDKQAAQDWCDAQGLGENYCLPRVAP